MTTIDKLVAAGRDPLEALFVPPGRDVEQWLKEDDDARLDKAIVSELSTWSPAMRERLKELVSHPAPTEAEVKP